LITAGISLVVASVIQRIESIIWPEHGSVTGWIIPVIVFGGTFSGMRWISNLNRRMEAEKHVEVVQEATEPGSLDAVLHHTHHEDGPVS
jgi:hypothetical protein